MKLEIKKMRELHFNESRDRVMNNLTKNDENIHQQKSHKLQNRIDELDVYRVRE